MLHLFRELGIENSAVIISPSMSGSYSLPFLIEHPEKVKAFIPIAPVKTGDFIEKFHTIKVSLVKVLCSWDGHAVWMW